jgi:deazaflavin-dependent oxidoreductase (nitroreductase family)
LPILILTTTGNKTGQPRVKALSYLPYGEAFVVIASNLGQDHHPAWWINLKANPVAHVQVRDKHFTVRAREAEGDERERIWQALSEKTSDYEQYRTWAARRIPVVVLERVKP